MGSTVKTLITVTSLPRAEIVAIAARVFVGLIAVPTVVGNDGLQYRLYELLSRPNRTHVDAGRNARCSRRNTGFDSRNISATRQAPTSPHEQGTSDIFHSVDISS